MARRRGWRSVSLLGAVSLLLAFAACTLPGRDRPTPVAHPVFNYASFGPVEPISDQFHPGETITVRWEPRRTEQTSSEREDVTLSAALFGPFETVDALKQEMAMRGATGWVSPDTQPVAVSVPPVKIDTWSGETYTMTLELPASLAPGYYSLLRSVDWRSKTGSSSAQAQGVIEVVAE